MKGAASRVSALVIAVYAVAAPAFAQPEPEPPEPAVAAPSPADTSDITDRDRVWVNFTREAAVVGEKHFWIELRGMKLMNDQSIKQQDNAGNQFEGPTLGLNGYPLNVPKCDGAAEEGCIEEIDGGRFDLLGAYGVMPNLEVGIDLPFVMQEQIDFVGDAEREAAGLGDLLLYGKFKRQLATHIAGAIGLEITAPTGSTKDRFGSGHTGLNPFLSARYQSGRVALGSHVGFLLNVDDPPDVFNWSVEGIVRGNSMFALRCEINGRLFKTGGETFNDVAVWPGLDFNLTENFIIRPQALAHLTTDAIDWGLGLGLAFTM
jgi:hypothetical protein